MNVLLPAFRRPTTAILRSVSSGASLGDRPGDLRKQFIAIPAVVGRDGHRLAVPQRVKVVDADIEFRVIGFVGDKQHRLADGPQSLGDGLIERHDAIADIDDKQHDGRFLDRESDLPFDIVRQVVVVDDAHPAGVAEFEPASVGFDGRADAVPGDSRRGIDNADPPSGEPIEQGRFADVRPTDDCNERECHRFSLRGGPETRRRECRRWPVISTATAEPLSANLRCASCDARRVRWQSA
jgi:hypothetical protein